jgi:uncharacterized membrane protein YdbT with pleckstrin-like domain
MRQENTWFQPEQLARYLFFWEAFVAVLVVASLGLVALAGGFAEAEWWVFAIIAGVFVAVFGFVTWWIPAFFRSAQYRLTGEELEYHRGVFLRQKTTVPYDRITNVNAVQGPVQRLLDCGSVAIHTAGYGGQTGAELTIGAIADYEDVKEQVLEKVRGRPAVATESGRDPVRTEPQTVEDGDTAVLTEIRRIRELLERGGTT